MGKGKKVVVTSLDHDGYEEYGKRYLECVSGYWPSGVKKIVYYDGDPPRGHVGTIWRTMKSLGAYQEYLSNISKFPFVLGNFIGQDGSDRYNKQFDAKRARMFFILDALATEDALKDHRVFWSDADIITHTPIPESFLDKILPDDKIGCFIGRDELPMRESEMCFWGLNLAHSGAKQLLLTCLEIYQSGLIFAQRGWSEPYAFDLARKSLQVSNPNALINIGRGVRTTHTCHVFVNSILSKYMDHPKGGAKSSPEKDRV